MSSTPHHALEVVRVAEHGYDALHFRSRDRRGEAGETVHIYLGTEHAQWRAERAFLWSVLRHAHPQRDYVVHRMIELEGFDPRAWTTGFTNYRFAIPDLAGGRGRAIYNDVDQVYLGDPGPLFDLDLEGFGYRARTDTETSVMVLDCERMSPTWNGREARRRTKKTLNAAARAKRGPLAERWNARDGEYRPGDSQVLHFTTLHTQPWRPFPHHFLYEPHPQYPLWAALESEALAAGFAVYDRERPSSRFAAWLDSAPREAPPSRTAQEGTTLARACGVEKLEFLDAKGLRALLCAAPT